MSDTERLREIRANEQKAHIAMYTNAELYKNDSWLRKPIKTVTDLFPYFASRTKLNVLDLGCGIGRNCIAIADQFRTIPCRVDCVDILDLAIEKLEENAREYGVSDRINGIVRPIDDFPIEENGYDWILAVSSLEHMDSIDTFTRKLDEIKRGICTNGVVCLVINSNVREYRKCDHSPAPAQFEVNVSTEELQQLLKHTFAGWKVLKSTKKEQCYDIPRGDATHTLETIVVTLVAVKSD